MNFQIEFFQNKIKNRINISFNSKSNYLSNLDIKKEDLYSNRSRDLICIKNNQEKNKLNRDLSFRELDKIKN